MSSIIAATLRPLAFALLALGFSLAVAKPLDAQDPLPYPRTQVERPGPITVQGKIAELEKRIKELETSKQGSAKQTNKNTDVCPSSPASDRGSQKKSSGDAASGGDKTDGTDSSSSTDQSDSTGSFGGFKDGFIIKSADKKNQMRITGQIQTDMRAYGQKNDTTDIDTFLIRRARLGIEANVADYYEFRFLPDFGNNQVVIQDCYMNVHYWDELQFQFGKFKEPVSYEQYAIQDRYVPTLERSLIDQIAPARDVGMMVHGQKLLDDRFDYAAGIFNGEVNGNIDTNKLKDFAGRVAWRPFNDPWLPEWMYLFQVGVSGTIGVEQEPLSLNGTDILRTPGNIPWLTFNSAVLADGLRTRITPEISYFYRALGFATQYMRMDQDMRSGLPTILKGKPAIPDPIRDIGFDGYYFLTTYLLTGEERTTYSMALAPLRPFDLAHPFASPGAWELVGRLSHLQVSDEIFAPGSLNQLANPAKNSNAATELSLGFNWYLNAFVRVQFNWEHAWYADPLLLGPPNYYFHQTNAALLRFQIIF